MGYGHYVIFSSLAALGAALALSVAASAHTEGGAHHLDRTTVNAMVTVPMACSSQPCKHSAAGTPHAVSPDNHRDDPLAAALVLAATWTRIAVYFTAAVLALLLTFTHPRPRLPPP